MVKPYCNDQEIKTTYNYQYHLATKTKFIKKYFFKYFYLGFNK